MLGVAPDGLIDGLFAGVEPDEAMVEAVRRRAQAGVRTALVSNSWGVHRYPHDLFDELFDGVVISGEEGMRKPAPRMYELGAERAGVAAAACVFVDDLPFNLTPAEELGMATVHHTSRRDHDPASWKSCSAASRCRRRTATPRGRQLRDPLKSKKIQTGRPPGASGLLLDALAPPVHELEHPREHPRGPGLVRVHEQSRASAPGAG